MDVRDININDVQVLENVRVKLNKIDGLMRDIEQHGLYNPIKVAKTKTEDYILIQGHRRLTACKKLGWKKIPATISEDVELADLLVTNMAENVHREDISPIELGRICMRLKKEFDMTASEIAAKLSLSTSRIEGAMKAYNGMPDKYRNRVTYTGKGNARLGNIPATTALKIIATKRKYGLSDTSVDKLLKVAKAEEYGSAELHIISMFLQDGYTVSQAIEQTKRWKYMRTDVVVEEEDIQHLLNKYKMDSKILLLNAIIYGEVPPLKRPSWFKTKQVPVKG